MELLNLGTVGFICLITAILFMVFEQAGRQTEGRECKGGKGTDSQLFDNHSFQLTTSGGTTISASLRDLDNAKRSINGMRALLREKNIYKELWYYIKY